MRRIGVLLVVLLSLHCSVPAWADLANCDGPTTAEEGERRKMLEDADPLGTNPVYAAANGLLDACEGAKKKINSALESLSGTTRTSPASSQGEEAVPQTQAISAPRAPMSLAEALVARRYVIDGDEKAHAAVGASGTTCRAGADVCRRVLESIVDPVIREADKLKANPEYLAQLPPPTLASVEFANRMGWTLQNGKWTFGAGNEVSASGRNTGTVPEHVLSIDECKKLRDTLDREIKANNTGEEPFNFSFFEGECAPQAASYAEDVKNWRALLAAKPSLAPPTDAAAKVPELAQWHNNLLAEESRRVAEDDERRRIEAERQAQQLAVQQKAKLAAAEQARRSLPPSSGYSSVCARNEAKVQEVLSASPYRDYSGLQRENEDKIRLFAALHAPCAADEASRSPGMGKTSRAIVEGVDRELETHRQNCSRWDLDCTHYYYDTHTGAQADSTRNYMQLYRREVETALSDPNYSADLEPVAGQRQAARSSQASDDAACEAKLDVIEGRVAEAASGCGASATCNLQAAMWGLEQQVSTIERYCPSEEFAARLLTAKTQLKNVTATCNQIQSGGGHCSPRL